MILFATIVVETLVMLGVDVNVPVGVKAVVRVNVVSVIVVYERKRLCK